MIDIIFAPPRTGKTCYMTHMANTIAFDRQRTRAMQTEILSKQSNGFDSIQTIPQHCVAANYDITLRKFGYRPRYSRRINPYRLGFDNKFVDVHFSLPYECYFISEAQKYFDSHLALYYPAWQSRYYEQHGHNNLDFYLDTQRPMLINPNIRELSKFTEIVDLDMQYDRFGEPCRLQWLVRHIDNSGLFDKYMLSGKQDKSCYIEEVVTADYNVFACYDSRACKPKFYAGHFDKDFDYSVAEPTEETLEGYIRYLQENDDELPENFYVKRGKAA